MLLVISPAKTLDFDTAWKIAKTTQPDFLDYSQTLINGLKKLSPHDISALMSVSDKIGTLNFDRFHAWQLPFDESNAKPAMLAFKGDVYTGLDAESFDAKARTFAQKHLRILSGLYGLLRPLDLMQAYRLEMGTKFSNPVGADLYAFWGDKITQALNTQLQASRSDVLVNLASAEYFRAVKKSQLNKPILTPVFKDYKNGQYKIISFFAKKARGLMAAYVIENQLTEVEELKAFDSDGYQFDAASSSDTEWVFKRKLGS
ncbi:peroxide stress protein YaaA [Simiduia litorea]